jgi:hypothetical protein
LLDEFDGEGPARAFVAVDGGRHEDEVGTDEFADEGKGNSGGFVNDDEFGLAEDMGIFG